MLDAAVFLTAPGNAVFIANPACRIMKEPIPIQQWLPAGPLRDMGEKYVSQLPDVAQNPIGPESLMHQSDHSWSEYLVAYSLLYPGIVIILALLGIPDPLTGKTVLDH